VLYCLVIPSIIINLVNSLRALSKLTGVTRLYNIIGEEVEVGKVEDLLEGRLDLFRPIWWCL
jgi:hypothetical protein